MKSYVPGDWYAAVGERATVLLAPTDKWRVPALWALVDEGAGFEELLDQIVASGRSGLGGFALIGQDGDSIRVLVRGSVQVTVRTEEGPVQVSGVGPALWQELRRSTSSGFLLEVETSDSKESPPAEAQQQVREEFSLLGGLVRVECLRSPALRSETAVPRALDMGARAVDPAPPPLPVPPVPRVPAVPEPRPTSTAAVATVRLGTGEAFDVDRTILFGRAPEARRFQVGDEPRLVTVPSPQQEISSTHLEIRPASSGDLGSVLATDLGSTNGSLLVQPGLEPERLRAGVPVLLASGARIDLGDGVTLQIDPPAGRHVTPDATGRRT